MTLSVKIEARTLEELWSGMDTRRKSSRRDETETHTSRDRDETETLVSPAETRRL